MKKLLLTLFLIASVLGLQAQNRMQLAQFSLVQQYFNPAMTGFDGSQVKTLYRDQFTGFTDAPQSLLVAGEFNANLASPQARAAGARTFGSDGAFGFTILRDTFGPFKETQLNFGYGSRVRLSEQLSLRAGAAITYQLNRLDANKLTVDDLNDSEYQNLWGSDNNEAHKLDVNAGLALTGQHFYLGYAIQDLAQGRMTSGDAYYDNIYPLHHVVQGGYRQALTGQIGLVLNGIYRYDSQLKGSLEGQLKGVWNNMLWAGIGYRKDLALGLTMGLAIKQFRLGYVRETVTGKAEGINAGTNELLVSYRFGSLEKIGNSLSIW